MHKNSPFWYKKYKNFLGKGTAPSLRLHHPRPPVDLSDGLDTHPCKILDPRLGGLTWQAQRSKGGTPSAGTEQSPWSGSQGAKPPLKLKAFLSLSRANVAVVQLLLPAWDCTSYDCLGLQFSWILAAECYCAGADVTVCAGVTWRMGQHHVHRARRGRRRSAGGRSIKKPNSPDHTGRASQT